MVRVPVIIFYRSRNPLHRGIIIVIKVTSLISGGAAFSGRNPLHRGIIIVIYCKEYPWKQVL